MRYITIEARDRGGSLFFDYMFPLDGVLEAPENAQRHLLSVLLAIAQDAEHQGVDLGLPEYCIHEVDTPEEYYKARGAIEYNSADRQRWPNTMELAFGAEKRSATGGPEADGE